MSQSGQIKPECRFCALLEASVWTGKQFFRCQVGRFDDKYGRKYFVWSSIWRPGKRVAAVQKDCPYFQLHPQAKQISRRGRL